MHRLARAVLLSVAGISAHPAAAATVPLFGTVEFRVDSLAELPQWQRVLRRADAEQASLRGCLEQPDRCPTRSLRGWATFLHDAAALPPRAQVEAVHRFLNARPYRADAENYGRSDYWATPLEFLRRSGDCEDYVIAKYRSLRLLGLPAERLRMVVVQDVVRDLPHAVLAVYLDGEALILDNLAADVLPQARFRHYLPYYSVNERSRWVHAAPEATMAAALPGGVQPARP